MTVILSRPDDRAILTYPGAIRDLTADHVDPDPCVARGICT